MLTNPSRSMSLLTCTAEELENCYESMLAQEKVEAAALKWTRCDIKKVKSLRKSRFDID